MRIRLPEINCAIPITEIAWRLLEGWGGVRMADGPRCLSMLRPIWVKKNRDDLPKRGRGALLTVEHDISDWKVIER
jgi:hypothetical protein